MNVKKTLIHSINHETYWNSLEQILNIIAKKIFYIINMTEKSWFSVIYAIFCKIEFGRKSSVYSKYGSI